MQWGPHSLVLSPRPQFVAQTTCAPSGHTRHSKCPIEIWSLEIYKGFAVQDYVQVLFLTGPLGNMPLLQNLNVICIEQSSSVKISSGLHQALVCTSVAAEVIALIPAASVRVVLLVI